MEPGSAPQVVQPNGVATSSNYVYVTSDSGMLKESQDGAHAAHTSAQEVSTVSNQAAKSLDDPQKQPGPNAKGPPLVVKLAVASLGVSTLFYVMLFIYLGASSNQTAYTQNIHVAVANFDTGMVGQAFMQFASNVPAGNGLPSLQVCTEFNSVNKFTRHRTQSHLPRCPTCSHATPASTWRAGHHRIEPQRPHKPRRQRRVLGGALRCVRHLLQHDGGHRRRQPQRLPAVQVPTARCNPGPLQSGRLFLSLRPLTNPHFSCLYAFADVDLWLYGRPTAIARPLHSASLLLALSSRLRCSAVTPPALHPAAAQSPSSTTRAGSRPR